MKARVAIFNLNGRESIWWEHLRKVNKINDRKIMWKQFKKYFKQKYLSDRYYDDKIKEFHELKLGQLTMEEYANKFLELLRYVRYIKDDKVKIQHFLSGIPQSYKDKIDFDEPTTLEEAIKKAKYCYDQKKGKPYIHKACKDKNNEKFDERKKGFKPSHFLNQQRKSSQAVTKPSRVMDGRSRNPKEIIESLQCLRC